MPLKVSSNLRPWAAMRALAGEMEDIAELMRLLEEDGFEVATRYGTGADAMPDFETMCPGDCEGMGCVPIDCGILPEGHPKRDSKELIVDYDQDHIDRWRDAWLEAEAKEPTEDGWHFLTCPACDGTGKRPSTMSPEKEAIQQAVGEAASIHWPASEEVFDSTKAEEIAEALASKLGIAAFKSKRSIVFDFDGTIAGELPFPQIGEPIWPTIEMMRVAKDAGIEVVIQSCRWSEHELSTLESASENLVVAKAWLEANDVPYDRLAAGKPLADLYVDDKACHVNDVQKLEQVIMELASQHPVDGSLNVRAGHSFWVSPSGEVQEFDASMSHAEGYTMLANEDYGDLYESLGSHNKIVEKALDEGWSRIWTNGQMVGVETRKLDDAAVLKVLRKLPQDLLFVRRLLVDSAEKSEDLEVEAEEDAADAWEHRKSTRKSVKAALKVEAFGDVHEWGCLMLEFPDDLAKEAVSWGEANIPQDRLFLDPENPKDYGRETQIHTTVSYGIDPKTDPEDIQFMIYQQGKPLVVKLGKISKFSQAEKGYDVIKVEVESPDMRRLHGDIEMNIGTPGNTFPDYKPHVTIAYVKPGSCEDLLGQDPFAGREFDLTRFDYGYPPEPGQKDVHKHYDLSKLKASAETEACDVCGKACAPHCPIHARMPWKPNSFCSEACSIKGAESTKGKMYDQSNGTWVPMPDDLKRKLGIQASKMRAAQFDDLRKAALQLIEDDPTWKQIVSEPASAQAYGRMQQDIRDARSEQELQMAWEANMDMPWEAVKAAAGGRKKP